MIIILLFIFLFGLIIGSFLNAVIYRLEVNKSVFRGYSFCPNCKHVLAWYDLIPLFSFAWLQGKCRYCQENISIQYPLVELATGLLFLGIFYNVIACVVPLCGTSEALNQYGLGQAIPLLLCGSTLTRDCFVVPQKAGLLATTTGFYYFYIIGVLIIIFVYDLKHYIIPDKIIFPAIAVSLIWSLSIGNYLEIGNWKLEIGSFTPLLAALGASLFFFLLIVLSKGRWMGFGDVKLAGLMGLILGFPQILLALFTAVLAGAIMGVWLMVFNKKTLKSQIPFGPFLVGGTIFALFWGDAIINWYLNIFL